MLFFSSGALRDEDARRGALSTGTSAAEKSKTVFGFTTSKPNIFVDAFGGGSLTEMGGGMNACNSAAERCWTEDGGAEGAGFSLGTRTGMLVGTSGKLNPAKMSMSAGAETEEVRDCGVNSMYVEKFLSRDFDFNEKRNSLKNDTFITKPTINVKIIIFRDYQNAYIPGPHELTWLQTGQYTRVAVADTDSHVEHPPQLNCFWPTPGIGEAP